MVSRHFFLLMTTAFLCSGVLALGGCASASKYLPVLPGIPEDVTPQRLARNAEIAQNFEQERNHAQLQVALSRRAQGDWRGTREVLALLLDRDPSYVPAQQLMREIDLASPQLREATDSGVAENWPASPVVPSVILPSSDGNGLTSCVNNGTCSPHNGTPDLLPPSDNLLVTRLPKVEGEALWPVAAAYLTTDDEASGSHVVPASFPITTAMPISRTAEQINRDAVKLLRASKPEAAVELIHRSMTDDNHSADLYRTLGLALYRTGNYRASQLALQQALSLDNAHPLSYFLLGFTLRKLGDTHGADWHFREAAVRDPKFANER